MQVHEVMSRHPVTVRAGSSVRQAIRLLADHRVTSLPVIDDAGRILGVVSEVDLLRGQLGEDPGRKRNRPLPTSGNPGRGRDEVSNVMTNLTVLVHPETDLLEVARIVEETAYKSLPVVDAADQVVGMVSRSDIVQVLAREDDVRQQDIVDALSDAGLCGWRVRVRNGDVELSRAQGEPTQDARARAIAGAMPGIRTVSVLAS